MHFFSFFPKSIVGSTHVEVGRDDALASMPCKRAPNCDLVSKKVLVKPASLLRNKVGCDRKDSFMRNHIGFSGMFELTIGIGAFFPLASEIDTQLNGQILGENIGCIDVWILEEKHSHFLPILGGAIHPTTFLHLLCLLAPG